MGWYKEHRWCKSPTSVARSGKARKISAHRKHTCRRWFRRGKRTPGPQCKDTAVERRWQTRCLMTKAALCTMSRHWLRGISYIGMEWLWSERQEEFPEAIVYVVARSRVRWKVIFHTFHLRSNQTSNLYWMLSLQRNNLQPLSHQHHCQMKCHAQRGAGNKNNKIRIIQIKSSVRLTCVTT